MSIFRPRAARRSIRFKILAIAWVPSLVLLLVGVSVAGFFARQSINQNKFTSNYVQAVESASRFVAADQRERQLTVTYLLDPTQSRQDLDVARLQTDAALTALAPALDAVMRTGSDSFVSAITQSGASVGALPELRQGVDSGALTLREATNAYSQTLNVFHAAFENLATSAATANIAAEYQLTANLFRLADWRAESQTFEQAAYSSIGLTDQEVGVYLDRVGGYHSLLSMTVPRLSASEQATFKALLASTAWQQLTLVENTALRSGTTDRGKNEKHLAGPLPISQGAWIAASAEVSRMLIDQYLDHVAYSTGLATDHAQTLLLRSLVVGISLFLLSALVFAIVTRMSNRLIQRLRRLQNETMELVSQRLPAIVERLGRGEPVDVAHDLPPLVHGTDEIGQVADAFNQAQRTAVEAAAKEAETRSGTSKVFLNIAHRSQIVAHRQLKLLDQAERTQEDPDQLSLLFQLDHLTTRARRNAENLIILGGGQPGRQWRNPVPLLDVVRSAVGEAETYTGISIGQMPKTSVAGAAVADIIHLLAELVDNATSFSPPTARVEVRGNVAGRGVVIEIEDQGLGIETEQLDELNQMLHKPPDFSVMALSEEPRLGLFVVTQLAVRHGIRVTLTESLSYGGIRAVVLIPLALISSTVPTLPEMEARSGTARLNGRETIPGQVEVIGSVLPTRKSSRQTALAPGEQPGPDHLAAGHSEPLRPGAERSAPPSEEPWITQVPPATGRVTETRASADPMESLRARGFIEPLRAAPLMPAEGERRMAEIPVVQPQDPSSHAPPTPGAPQATQPGFQQAPRPGTSLTPPRGTPPAFSPSAALHPAPINGAQGIRSGSAPNPLTDPRPDPSGAGPTGRDQRPALPRRTRQSHLAPQLFRNSRTGVQSPPGPEESQISAENARDRLAAFQRGTRKGRHDGPDLGS